MSNKFRYIEIYNANHECILRQDVSFETESARIRIAEELLSTIPDSAYWELVGNKTKMKCFGTNLEHIT